MEQHSSFLDFLVKKSKNAQTNLNINQLAKEFKSNSGCPETVNGLISRIRMLRLQIPKFSNLDKETKVKLMFALSAPVPPSYLEILQKEAIVRTDGQQRITYYAEDGLILKRYPLALLRPSTPPLPATPPPPSSKFEFTYGDMRVFRYLADRATRCVPISDEQFLDRLETKSIKCSMERYQLLKNEIYAVPKFHKNSKIRMMFVTGAPVSEDVLQKLQNDGQIEVDDKFRIKKYTSNDGSLKLSPKTEIKVKRGPTQKKHERMSGFMKYIAEKTRNVTTPMYASELCRGYLEEIGSSDDPLLLADRLSCYKNTIHKLTDFDVQTRVKIIFALSSTVDPQFLTMLQENAIVEVDEKQRITRYESNDGFLRLRGEHSQKAKAKNRYSKIGNKTENAVKEVSMEDMEPNIKQMTYNFNEFRALIKSEIQKRKEAELENLDSRSRIIDEMDDVSLPGYSDETAVEQKCSAWLQGAWLPEEQQKDNDIQVISLNGVKIEQQEHQWIQTGPSLTHHKVLTALRTVILTIDSSKLHGTLEIIENKIRKTCQTSEISLDGVMLGMESCLHMVLKDSSMKLDPGEESRSLKMFLMLLRSATITMDSEILEKFQQKLKELVAELYYQDKFISIETIGSSLEIAITIFSP